MMEVGIGEREPKSSSRRAERELSAAFLRLRTAFSPPPRAWARAPTAQAELTALRPCLPRSDPRPRRLPLLRAEAAAFFRFFSLVTSHHDTHSSQ
uniref:Uncharacterized protein n=1 Tax=Arundo donax TaxID=35708 RepID=A0A0A9BR32_ARUDO